MAKVFLSSGDEFTISNNNVEVIGAAGTGTEKVTIQSGIKGVKTDANIERLDVAGNLSGYTFQAVAGTGVVIKDASGNTVATIPSVNQNVTVAFADGSATLVQTGGSAFTLGGQAISTTATAAITSTAMGSGFNTAVTSGSGTSTGGTVAGQTFTLTTGSDVPVLTLASDTINGATNGLLTSSDVIMDHSTTDSDTLTAVINSAAGTSNAARIQNVENINISGQYVTTGLALTNVSGADTLTLSTGIAGGTATVTDANSLNATTIVAGTNVSTLTVTSLSSGSRDTVTLNATTAANVDVTGNDGGADTYVVNVATGADVDLATLNASDNITINAVGTLALAGVTTLGDLTINASNDLTVDVTTGLAATTVVGNGAYAVTLSGAEAMFDGLELTKTGTGTVTVEVTDSDDTNLKEIIADKVEFSATDLATGDLLTINEGSTVVLSGAGSADLQIENAAGTITTGTLMLEVANDYTLITTNDNVDTLMISATEGSVVTGLTANDATDTIVMTGGDLTITTLTVGDAKVISATSMTGALTMTTSGAHDTTVVLGNGNNSITTAGGDDLVQGGSGADTISSGAAVDTLVGGAGDDSITGGGGNDSITGGAGNDAFVIGASDDNDTITDFVKGSDKIILTGAIVGNDFDVTDLTVSSAVYTLDTGKTVTLTGNTATDLSDSIQLGKSGAASSNAFKIGDTNEVVGGNYGDYFIMTANDDTATVTGGSGADVFYISGNDDANDTTGVMTITDFTVGTDKIVLISTANDDINLGSVAVSSGAYGLGNDTSDFNFVIEDSTATDLTGIVQLGTSSDYFVVKGGQGNYAIVASDFADFISTNDSTGNDHTITGGLGADTIKLNDDAASSDNETITIAAGDSTVTAWDVIYNFGSNDINNDGNDDLNLDSTTVGTGLGSVDVGAIASASVSAGIVTFKNSADSSIAAADLNLTDALSFLATNAVGTDTFAFEVWVDKNADGDNTDAGDKSTFVFQSGTTDTVVELVGIVGVTGFAAATTNKIELS